MRLKKIMKKVYNNNNNDVEFIAQYLFYMNIW